MLAGPAHAATGNCPIDVIGGEILINCEIGL